MIKKLLRKLLSLNGLVLIVILNFPVFLSQVSAAPPANFQVAYPTDLPTEVATDLEILLEKTTGKAWDLLPGQKTQQGFNLVIVPANSYKTSESCIISSNGKDLVQFQAPTINGLIFGVYRHLRDLGFKFYLPDDIYTIIPAAINIFSSTTKTVTPNLRIREFFGTGGFGSGKTDADQSVQKAWQLWQWRNGFGAEFSLAGHVGETFNLENSSLLEKNPSWTATPIRQNGQVNINTKLNYFNPAALDYFTSWVIKKYTDKNYKAPAAYIRDMVSVEPADGGGYNTGSAIINGTKLTTPSDQVFFAANMAAKKLDALFPDHTGIGVNLYAYSGHADTPSFPLHPRVFVQIIPYQFQSVAFGPAFIKRWSEKAKRFGIYDYFKYPDIYWDQPGGYSLDQLMTRALHAARSGSEGTTYESSYSKFATAIPLWVLSRYMADGNAKWETAYNQLIKDLYGTASSAIGELFKLFYRQSQFSHTQLKQSFDLLQKAFSQTSDILVKQRLEELKLYLIYLNLYQESMNLKKGDLEQRQIPVYKIAWTMYERKIIHSYRIMQLISYGFLNTPGHDAATTKHYQQIHQLTFPESDHPNAYWHVNNSTSLYNENELNELFYVANDKLKTQTVLPTEIPKTASIFAAAKIISNPVKQVLAQSNSLHRAYFSLYCDRPTRISIGWTLRNEQQDKSSVTISGTNKDYSVVYDKQIKSEKETTTFDIPAGESYFFINAGAGTTYKFNITLNGAYIWFSPSPRISIGFFDNKNNPTYLPPYFPTYFYVPHGVSEVRYKVQLNALKIYAPGGNPVATTLLETGQDFETRSFKVAPGDQGKFWNAVVSGNFNYELLTIPDQWYILQPK